MGARESRAQNPEDVEGQAGPPDYYELLEVDENATQDEIRVRVGVSSFAEYRKFFDHELLEIIQKTSPNTSSRQESRRCRRCDKAIRRDTAGIRGPYVPVCADCYNI